MEDAIGAGRPSVPVEVDGTTVPVPATVETLAALNDLAAARLVKEDHVPGAPAPDAPTKAAPEFLQIRPNEAEVEVEGAFVPRPAPLSAASRGLATPLKPRQEEGLSWLQKAWAMGRPGVLLADDMGLGKTVQGLAFLVWLRGGMEDGTIPRAPVAVVAPTGLLQTGVRRRIATSPAMDWAGAPRRSSAVWHR